VANFHKHFVLSRFLDFFLNGNFGNYATSVKDERTKKDMVDFPHSAKLLSCFKKYLMGLFVLLDTGKKKNPIDRSK
jgi:hypothetical protein